MTEGFCITIMNCGFKVVCANPSDLPYCRQEQDNLETKIASALLAPATNSVRRVMRQKKGLYLGTLFSYYLLPIDIHLED
jgi:hypothetical protein